MSFINHIVAPRKVVLLLIACAIYCIAAAQPPTFNFHQLSTGNGLHDPTIRSITQDKYGYIWIGTATGLNRFNGYDVKVFQHQANDSFTIPENRVFALLADKAGTLWIAQPNGVSRYDYRTNRFIYQPGSKGIAAYKMLQGSKTEIYLATREGLVLFDVAKGTFTWLKKTGTGISASLLGRYVNDFCGNNNNIYIATDSGLVRYNMATQLAEKTILAPVRDAFIGRVAMDHANNIWVGYGENGLQLLKTNERLENYITCDQFTLLNTEKTDNRITSIFTDDKGRVWLSTSQFGICLYNQHTNSFACYMHDPLQVMSISDNLTNTLFQDRQGYMWVGTEVSGVNYFHPDNTFFRSIQPSYNQSPTLPDYWCRASGEDKNGNLWLATAQGIAEYNTQKNTYRLFQHTTGKNNSLHFNSVRSVLCDGDIIWIGTANGLNRYHLSTGKMDFLGEKENLPESFFWSIIKDYQGNIWFGCRDGIYRYNNSKKLIERLFNDPQLGAYAGINTESMYEDSRHRIWFGFNSKGLLMYDPIKAITKYWVKNEQDPTAISDDHITSITEDKKGVIWIATLDGLNAWHEDKNTFTRYLQSSGMISSLLADEADRLWLASGKGLLMLDSSRQFFSSFDISNGLPTLDFNYQDAYRMKNGDFVYPTLKGFILFNPSRYVSKNNISESYIAAATVYGKKPDTIINFEDKKTISLTPDENFFSFDMIALNYGNPKEIWYAHQLEPFDKEWIYSKDRTVNYTNVPGGDYIYHYKTSTDVNKWSTPEKSITIHLATIFYKTWWFKLLAFLLVSFLLIVLYKYRISQREKFFSLQSKANSLEKEKVLVMYESLKQQLNPHFLFNSLTSLSGLITANPAHAKQFLDRMSKIYRYILTSRDHETVSLAEEIKLATIYTELQQTRFKEGLQVNVQVPEIYLHRKVAPVTIQNLIENAIKHNIVDEARPLRISIFVEDNQLVVGNNLQKKKFVETSNKQGLANMQSLYNYLGGRPVIVRESETEFVVRVPLL
ncbi:MAG: two-component regulator propeller domain-containing protein [Chitinophagaceae bacterium]